MLVSPDYFGQQKPKSTWIISYFLYVLYTPLLKFDFYAPDCSNTYHPQQDKHKGLTARQYATEWTTYGS